MNTTPAILCVDDEIMILDTIKEQLLRSFGNQYLYESAENATEAWEIIEDFYDAGVRLLVIVSDWLMPDVKGDEFLTQVHHQFPDIVNIMLTGQADADAIEHAKQTANLYACLHKPWQESELISLISHALG